MHDQRVDLLGRARRAVELGDYAEAQALAAIALADAGDELTAWVAHVHEDLEELPRVATGIETLGAQCDDIITMLGAIGR
jgi:hypothetical protein